MGLFMCMCVNSVYEISVTHPTGWEIRYLYASSPQILQLAPRKAIRLLCLIYFKLNTARTNIQLKHCL